MFWTFIHTLPLKYFKFWLEQVYILHISDAGREVLTRLLPAIRKAGSTTAREALLARKEKVHLNRRLLLIMCGAYLDSVSHHTSRKIPPYDFKEF